MTITKERKTELIAEFGQSEADVGSPRVQIAVLTHRINALTGHMKSNHKDHASRRGLLGMVSRRRRLLDFLKRNDVSEYQKLIERLGIRK
jgi:small subunit ribosomal protein S15